MKYRQVADVPYGCKPNPPKEFYGSLKEGLFIAAFLLVFFVTPVMLLWGLGASLSPTSEAGKAWHCLFGWL